MNTNPQTDVSDGLQSTPAADDEMLGFRKTIRLAKYVFGMPDDLIWANKIVPEMIAVLELYMPLAEPAQKDELATIARGLEEIRERQDWDEAHFPWAIPKNRSKEPSLYGYYEEFPHYSVYLHRPEAAQFFAKVKIQWRCMVATMLPMLIELDQFRKPPAKSTLDAAPADQGAGRLPKTAAKSMANRHVVLCRQLRKFAGAGLEPYDLLAGRNMPSLIDVLMELPQEAMPLERWLHSLDAVSERLDIAIDRRGLYKELACLRNIVRDKLGDWTNTYDGRQSHGLSIRGAKVKPLTSYVEVAKETCTTLTVEDTDGKFHRLRHYVALSASEATREDASDPDLKAERQETGSTMTLDSDRSLEYYLHNRGIWTSSRSKYFSQAVEMSNQHLSMTGLTLSGFELGHFLRCISDLSRIEWNVVPANLRQEVAAWSGFRFFLSRGPEEIKKFRFPERQQPVNNLGVRAGKGKAALVHTPPQQSQSTSKAQALTGELIEGWVAAGSVVLRSPSPRHAPPKTSGKTVRVASLYKLRLPGFMDSLIGALSQTRLSLFGHEVDHEGYFKSLLREINRHCLVEITAHKLELAIADRMSQLASSDRVIGNYFKGAVPNSHIPSIYSSIPVSRIQDAFDQACEHFQAESGVPIIPRPMFDLPGLSHEDEIHIGSLHYPTVSHMKETVQTVLSELTELSALPGVHFVELHNLYTAFCVMSYMATCGARPMGEIFPTISDIDWATGVAFMSSKDNDQYQHANLIWIHPDLLDQFKKYGVHVQNLRQYLAPLNIDSVRRLDIALELPEFTKRASLSRARDLELLQRHPPLFFFLSAQTGNILRVTPTLLTQNLGKDWELRAVALRHFVRSQLLGCGLGGEVIGALMGHADQGQHAWAHLSSMPPAAWRRQLHVALSTIIESIGLQSVDSPFLVGSN